MKKLLIIILLTLGTLLLLSLENPKKEVLPVYNPCQTDTKLNPQNVCIANF